MGDEANRPKSMLIAVEGIDGAGKTTQVNLLKDFLERAGEVPIVSREPTEGPWGTLIRESTIHGRLSVEAELNAFINDRIQHSRDLVLPALRDDRIVILDRYFYSTIAYQGARGQNAAEIKRMMESELQFPIPDTVFVLDIEPGLALSRIARWRRQQPDHFERPDELDKVRTIFDSLHGGNIHHIDGALTREDVHSAIVTILANGPFKARQPRRLGVQASSDAGSRVSRWLPDDKSA